MKIINLFIVLATTVIVILALSVAADAQPVAPYPLYSFPSGFPGVPITNSEILVAQGGVVIITYLGWSGSAFNEYLFIATPNNPLGQVISEDFFQNSTSPAGATVEFNGFTNGEEIVLGLYVQSTGNTWLDGPAARNSDNTVHAYVTNNYEGIAGLVYVGFEDEAYPGGDFNYTDESVAIQGVVPMLQSVAPAPNSRVTIESVKIQSGNVVFAGSNGVPNRVFAILASTNLSATHGNCWIPIVTNTFDTNGDFNISVSANSQQQFFKIAPQ